MIDLKIFDGHTRGSWRASEVMAHSAGFAIESEAGEQLARVMKTHGPEKLPSRANARLLAAAPDLLAEVIRLRAEVVRLRAEAAA